MALATRVIPTLLARGHQLVKGERFQSWRTVGHVQQAVRIHQAREVDELVVLDIAATPAGRGPDFGMVEKLAAECFMPLSVGGGVRSLEDVLHLLRVGADKIVLGTNAVPLALPASRVVGSQAIVVAIDVTQGRVAWSCGRAVSNLDPVTIAKKSEDEGAGEILLTSIDREGTMQGYDLELVRAVSEAVSIPVVAHGGCSGPEDMLAAIKAGAHGVAAGALFQFTDWTPSACSQYLADRGVEGRC